MVAQRWPALALCGLRRPAPAARALIVAEDKGWASRPLVPELAQSSTVTPADERTPWEWKRFLKQSSEFIELPSLPSLTGKKGTRVIQPGESFGDLQLFPLDDVVMGGASSSSGGDGRSAAHAQGAHGSGLELRLLARRQAAPVLLGGQDDAPVVGG